MYDVKKWRAVMKDRKTQMYIKSLIEENEMLRAEIRKLDITIEQLCFIIETWSEGEDHDGSVD